MLNHDQGETAISSQDDAVDGERRKFLYVSSVAAAITAIGVPLTASAATGYSGSRTTRVPPKRSRGTASVNVLNYGARNDGSGDSTTAFQKAVDALPASGGTVTVPAGTYRIDPDRGVKLRSKMLFNMSVDAKLVSLAGSKERNQILLVNQCSDVEIAGGRLVGDRDIRKGSGGEWGHGVDVRGSKRVTIRDMHLSNFWGDGIWIGCRAVWRAAAIPSEDVHVANVVSTNNRRQGLSVEAAKVVRIYDSEFSNSNGTSPECGIDIEPVTPSTAWDIRIENCLIRGNKAYGILFYKNTRALTVNYCTVEKNGSNGIVTYGAKVVYVANSTIRENGATGMAIQASTADFQYSRNLSYRNYTRLGARDRTPFTQVGMNQKVERDILQWGSNSDVRVTTNYYR